MSLKHSKYSSEVNDLLQIIGEQKRHPKQINGLNEADCEIVKLTANQYLAINIDSMAEEISAKLYVKPYTIGRMAATSSLSDLVTIGGEPTGVLISVLWGKDWKLKDKQDFYRGFNHVLKKHKLFLLGGDSGSQQETSATVTAFAVSKHKPTTRVGAKPGDLVCLLGKTGDGPALAFRYLQRLPTIAFDESSYDPKLYFKEAQIINPLASAIIDTSDGLVTALNHLSLINQVGFNLQWNDELISKKALAFCHKNHIPPFLLWIGEHGDYQLLFTISKKNFSKIKHKIRELHIIGEVSKGKTTFLKDGNKLELDFSTLVSELYRRKDEPHLLLKDLIEIFKELT